MLKVFGIPSWLPDKEPDRSQRIERINRLFKQLNSLWPDIDILVIAQNWKDFIPIKTKNKQIILNYEPLGILKARMVLREEFLKRDYDYIIMFDDDAIIECDNDHAHIDFMNEIDKHKNGFCFIHGYNNKYHPYIGAQLNLCAISKYIYEREPMVPIDAQKNEGYEDSIFAGLLHYKWTKYEFNPPSTIRPIQFANPKEKAPSTWADTEQRPWAILNANTDCILKYIAEYKQFPEDYKSMLRVERKHPETTYIGRKNTYLYF